MYSAPGETKGLSGINTKRKRSGDKHWNKDLVNESPKTRKINTANKSVEYCWLPNRAEEEVYELVRLSIV